MKANIEGQRPKVKEYDRLLLAAARLLGLQVKYPSSRYAVLALTRTIERLQEATPEGDPVSVSSEAAGLTARARRVYTETLRTRDWDSLLSVRDARAKAREERIWAQRKLKDLKDQRESALERRNARQDEKDYEERMRALCVEEEARVREVERQEAMKEKEGEEARKEREREEGLRRKEYEAGVREEERKEKERRRMYEERRREEEAREAGRQARVRREEKEEMIREDVRKGRVAREEAERVRQWKEMMRGKEAEEEKRVKRAKREADDLEKAIIGQEAKIEQLRSDEAELAAVEAQPKFRHPTELEWIAMKPRERAEYQANPDEWTGVRQSSPQPEPAADEPSGNV